MTATMLIAVFGTALISASTMAAGMLIGARLVLRGRASTLLQTPAAETAQQQSVTTRIDIADLRARMKRLEAIAAGVDL